MWPKTFEVKDIGMSLTFDLIDDVTHETLMVYLSKDHKSVWEMKRDTDYTVNGSSIIINSQIVNVGDVILVYEMHNMQKELLYKAQVLFKMAFAMHTPSPPERFQYLGAFSWGKHVADNKELVLNSEEEELAISLLHHVATYLLANQIDTYLGICQKDRFTDKNPNIRDAACIARLIRNAFAHNPFMPQWQIRMDKCKDRVLNVSDIIELNTNNLDGKEVSRYDYGGPLALFRLSEYVKQNV
jgi:hypothetical protein